MLLARYADDNATEHSTSIQAMVNPCSQAICRKLSSGMFVAGRLCTVIYHRAHQSSFAHHFNRRTANPAERQLSRMRDLLVKTRAKSRLASERLSERRGNGPFSGLQKMVELSSPEGPRIDDASMLVLLITVRPRRRVAPRVACTLYLSSRSSLAPEVSPRRITAVPFCSRL